MWSCRASRESLLRVFHMASVSADISSVSRNAVALSAYTSDQLYMRILEKTKHKIYSSALHWGFAEARSMFSAGAAVPVVVAVIDGCTEFNEALIQGVRNRVNPFSHDHFSFTIGSLQVYDIPLWQHKKPLA